MHVQQQQRGRRFVEPHNMEQVVTIQFKWGRETKLVSTTYVATRWPTVDAPS